MLKKATTLILGIFLTGIFSTSLHAHEPYVSFTTYKWNKDDSSVSLEIPYTTTNPSLRAELGKRVKAIGKKAFGKTFYIPTGPKDHDFKAEMATFYDQQKKASTHIKLAAPVLTFSLNSKTTSPSTPTLVSIELSASSMVKGAAHPHVTGGFINFNPKTGLFYDDLTFLPSSQQARIMSELLGKLKKKLGKNLLVNGEQLLPLLPSSFSMTKNTLNFKFQPGTVAPVFYGPQTITVGY